MLFDHAHANVHQTSGTYKPFADLLASDGYKVVGNDKPFSREALDGCDVLVIVNPTGSASGKDASAFTDAESDAVRAWVQQGGALLLVVDQPPYGSAAVSLARRFDIDVSAGYAIDKTSGNIANDDETELVFSRANKLLGDHPITEGRNAGEKINRTSCIGSAGY